MRLSKQNQGFTLIEILVSLAIFALFVVGIYGGIQLVFRIVYQSRVTIIESAILNEQVEIVRNLAFADVGIVGGSPSGLLARTVTTTRNNIDFEITRTIRNIDDAYDGTVGGNPNDTAPADYKLVQIEINCSSCNQRNPLSVQTYVSPKYLEGNPENGALFVQVFDASALPVQGAQVHVVATSTAVPVDFTDTTDNDGMLRIVDLSQGLGAYDITVSKSGFTNDATLRATQSIPNPVKPPASVIAQDVSEISFAIDQISSVDISTIDEQCQVVASVPFTFRGTKLLGTDPNTLKVNSSVQTSGSGTYTFPSLEWDSYAVSVSDYDLIGSIPNIPFTLLPASNQPVQLIVGSNASNSLLISVRDGITGQPVPNASVQVSSGGFDQTKITGVGSTRQTDWSLGSGQLFFSNQSQYWFDDGGIDVNNPDGDIKLLQIGQNYVASGELESSIFDLGTGVDYVNIIWEPISQPEDTDLKFRIATADNTNPSAWDYFGYDGTTSTYYTIENSVINSLHDGDRYLRYKAYLGTSNSTSTPVFSDISFTFTNSCTPPGQAYYTPSSGNYDVQITHGSYQVYNTNVEVSGDVFLTADLVAQ